MVVVVNGELQITVSKIHGNPRIVTFEEPAQMIPKSLHACHPLVGLGSMIELQNHSNGLIFNHVV
jgi:hypothetical protein